MSQTTTQQMDDGLSVWMIVANNARELSENGIEQRQFVQRSVEQMVTKRIPIECARKYLNGLAKCKDNKLKLKNVTRTFQAVGWMGY